MPVVAYLDAAPSVGDGVRMEDAAYVVGNVLIEGPARIATRASVRADRERIELGRQVRIGPGTSLHVDRGFPTLVGAGVWIGADAVVHGAQLGAGTRVEDGAYVLSGGVVGAGSVVAAGALVTERTTFPDNSYLEGVPAQRTRDTTPTERDQTARMLAEALADH